MNRALLAFIAREERQNALLANEWLKTSDNVLVELTVAGTRCSKSAA